MYIQNVFHHVLQLAVRVPKGNVWLTDWLILLSQMLHSLMLLSLMLLSLMLLSLILLSLILLRLILLNLIFAIFQCVFKVHSTFNVYSIFPNILVIWLNHSLLLNDSNTPNLEMLSHLKILCKNLFKVSLSLGFKIHISFRITVQKTKPTSNLFNLGFSLSIGILMWLTMASFIQ